MKKIKKYILIAMLFPVLAACIKEEPMELYHSPDELPYPDGGKAIVEMSAFVPGDIHTKAMNDTPTINSMRVVVFGSSGFLKESVDVDVNDGYFQAATTNGNGTLYRFRVQLTLTDSKRLRVHVIANCDSSFPWKGEDEVMRKYAYTEGTEDAYWSRFILEQGLQLKKHYVDSTDSYEYDRMGEYFVVTDEVTEAFSNLPLLRNFAKISVESTTPQLVLRTDSTMAVINKPRRGSLAPSLSTGGFVENYYSRDYSYLKENYDGFSPFDNDLVNMNPDEVAFLPCVTTGSVTTGGDFMYERPRVTTKPSYLIIYGTYYPLQAGKALSDWKSTSLPENQRYPNNASEWLEPNGVDGFYKIDFMDEDGYYAIFRNFRYHIRITGVSKAGAATPGAAGSTGGTGDISSSTEAQGLVDISDGYGRIAVSFVEMTIVEQHPEIELKYKFIPNADDGDAGVNNALVSENGPVTIIIGDKTGPINVISDTIDNNIPAGTNVGSTGTGGTGQIRVLPGNDSEGYRTIRFSTNAPSTEDKTTQTIKIIGQIDEHRSIFREVKFILMEKQNMTVSCTADEPNPDWGSNYVEETTGEGVNVNIKIPILLPESMFPLVFNIESDALSITPNTEKYTTENLPVESGLSICDNKSGKTTFHYVKTLSYDEYNSLVDNNGKTVVCHFKTNKAVSASTVYVTNEYFNKGNASFLNYKMYNFKNLEYSVWRAAANTSLNFTFELDDEDTQRPRTVQVTLDGLVPQNANANGWGVVSADDGIYTWTISSGNSATLALRTTSVAGGYNGEYTVTLDAFDGVTSRAIYRQEELLNMDVIPLETVSITANANDSGNGQRTITSGIVTATFSSARRRSNYGYIQINNNSNIQFSTTGNKTITKIVFTYSGASYVGTVTINNGTGGEYNLSGTTGTWTGSSTNPRLNFSNYNGNSPRITRIEVTYMDV